MKRKFMSLILALAMLCSLFVPALAADETPAYVIPDVAGKIVILHTNDTHGADVAKAGASIGTAGVAQLKADFEAAGATVLLLSDGDAIMGKPLVSADKGVSAINFMNAAGYDAMTVGNHELDFGLDNLLELADLADFSILCANMVYEKTGKPIFDANKIFEVGGVKIGVFGLATPETLTKADASKMPGVAFSQGEKLYADAQAQVDTLKAAGADLIVCLGHLGIADESKGNQSLDVVKAVTGIDLFIDGHSHSTTSEIAKEIGDTNVLNGTKVVSTGTALANVGVVIYDKTAKTLTDSLISTKSYSKVDEAVNTVINSRDAAVKAEYGETIATTDVDLNGSRSGGAATSTNGAVAVTFPAGQGNRTAETNLGDYAADAILWQARKTLGENAVDAAITNGGGIRETLTKGNISKLDLLAVFPFGNTVATISVTGAELLEALEAATWSTPDAIGAFPQVSGIEFTIDTAVPYVNGDQYPASTYYAPANPGSRVTISTINGEAFDAAATYTLATNDFTAKGGDTYGVFKRVGGWKDVGVTLENALIDYTAGELGGKITAEKYGTTADRITIIPSDVTPGSWFESAAEYAIANGLMQGIGNNSFAPTGTVTRGTVFQTLYNMAGKPTVEGESTFIDISGKWYAAAAAWAESTGLAVVPANSQFYGDRAITRAEVATILYRHASLNKIIVTPDAAVTEAPDYATVGSWAVDGMTFAYSAGLVTGKTGGLLAPNDNAVRAELAKILAAYDVMEPTYSETAVSIEVPAQSGVPAHTVVGTLTLPTAASKNAQVPGVVMLHGTGSNKDEAGGGYAMAAPAMAAAGIATLRIDFMGNGDSTADYVNYSYTSANIDAKAAADYLAKLDVVNADELGVMGWSQGGTNALLAAAKYPDTFKVVVTWAGALELTGSGLFGDKTFDEAYAQAKEKGYYEMTFDWREPLHLGTKWFEDVAGTDVLAQVAKIDGRVLAIAGDQDTVVPIDNAISIKNAAKDGSAWIEDGADHTLNVFTGDYTAITSVISQTALFVLDTFGLLTEVAPAA
ncbi:conserved exported hypothetical protein [uncultured Eubacteriales bacterium]|uniref:SLH domain-containing protein n=1 Tax=uncultured Eubacteriales bacterium TaxID=172733 RepID=A0A212KFI4_9FIRM|nr:conserved exported hypothetical protein [uncultured Eubacteriales bacterium]